MKAKLLHGLTCALLTFLLVYCSLGCMVTGMFMDTDLLALALCCAGLSLVLCLGYTTRFGLVPLCLGALAVGYFYEEVGLSLERLVLHITGLYDKGYGWGVLQWSEWNELSVSLLPGLAVIAGVLTALVGATLTYRRLGWLGCGVGMLPFLLCVVLNDTVPQELYLGGLLLAVVLVLVTDRARRQNQGTKLTVMLVLPLLVAVVALFALAPRATYNGQEGAQKLEDFVLWLLGEEEVPDVLEGPQLIPGDQEKTVHLDTVGQREEKNQQIMTVEAQEDGILYLRGCAYDIYDGTSWNCTSGWNSWSLFYGATDETPLAVTIRTRSAHSVLYFPYSPYNAPQKVVGGRMRNPQNLRTYTIQYQHPLTYGDYWDAKNDEIGGQALPEYLQLPDETYQRALTILQKKVGVPTETYNAGQIWRNAIYICDWVRDRGSYDLNTGYMPEGETDFALWFLEKSKTGYCTHYASAAVVLLRAAGIPAQYVTGYVVDARADREVRVTDAQAHAWVEVFINGVGWVMLDPTPGGGLPQPGGEAVDPTGGGTGEATGPAATDPEGGRDTGPTEATGTQPTETTEATEPQTTETAAQTTGQTAATTQIAGVGGAQGPTAQAGQTRLLHMLWLTLGVLALLAAVPGQWRLRVGLTRHRLRRGSTNQRLLAHWALLERLCRAGHCEPEEALYWLAQKARFSNHAITMKELNTLAGAVDAQKATLQKRSLFRRLYDTLILALY